MRRRRIRSDKSSSSSDVQYGSSSDVQFEQFAHPCKIILHSHTGILEHEALSKRKVLTPETYVYVYSIRFAIPHQPIGGSSVGYKVKGLTCRGSTRWRVLEVEARKGRGPTR